MEKILDSIVTILSEFNFILEPQYLALGISLVILYYSNLTSRKDRNFNLQKEKYFKYQQVAERITAKIAVIEHDREKYITRIENTHIAHTKEQTIFIDNMDVFNTEKINEDSEEIAALLQIYFPSLCSKRDGCLQIMRGICSQIIIIDYKLQNNQRINRENSIGEINGLLTKLGDKPKEMINDMLLTLKEFEKSIIKI